MLYFMMLQSIATSLLLIFVIYPISSAIELKYFMNFFTAAKLLFICAFSFQNSNFKKAFVALHFKIFFGSLYAVYLCSIPWSCQLCYGYCQVSVGSLFQNTYARVEQLWHSIPSHVVCLLSCSM